MAAELFQNETLKSVDPEIYALIKDEERRQREGLELIASENFTSCAVMDAMGSCLTNKYSEGLPGKRYYGGNEVIDKVESLCQKRALEAFGLDPSEWGVNVQPYSGSTANFAAFSAVLQPFDRIMGLNLPSGGHLSHGFFRGQSRVNCSSKFFQSFPYEVDPTTGLVDYVDMAAMAKRFVPRLLVGGGSACPRDWDYAKMREIADSVGAKFLVDMAHYSGLVAAKLVRSPFAHADLVMTTTHKSLRGPRAALLFYRKDLEKQVNSSVFPGAQGGPHNHAIAAVAVQLREAATPEFAQYAGQVVANAQCMARALAALGYDIVTGGTDTHLVLWNLRPVGITGSKLEALCDAAQITLNKNTIHGDKSAMTPGGVRIGTPALTSRGFKEKDFERVVELLHVAVQLSQEIQEKSGKKMKDFRAALEGHEGVKALRNDVVAFASQFNMPGRFL